MTIHAVELAINGWRPWSKQLVENKMIVRFEQQEDFLKRLRLALDTMFLREVQAFNQHLSKESVDATSILSVYESGLPDDDNCILQQPEPNVSQGQESLPALSPVGSGADSSRDANTTTQELNKEREEVDATI